MRTQHTDPPDDARRQDSLLEELRRRASKDALSGLLNRAAMEYSIKERLNAMAPEESCALFIVDLDNFKQVNDTLGHQAGDRAIQQAGRVLSSLFHASDIVGRLGGDEFAVFLCGKLTEDFVREKAAAICEFLELALGDRETVIVTASVGVYLSGPGQEFDGLYQSADLALYKAKKTGKHQFCLKSRGSYQDGQSREFRPVNTIPLSALLEHMSSGVVLLEMGDAPRVIYVSPSFCRIIGSTPESFPLPMPLADLIHPDDYPPLLNALRRGIRQNAEVEHTHRVRAGDGQTWLWWHICAAQIEYDDAVPVMLVTTTDVSQFKETQQRQEEQIRRLQTAFGQTSKQLWEVDVPSRLFRGYTQDGQADTLTDGSCRFPDDLIASGWIHPDSVARFQSFARDLLRGHSLGFGNFAIRSKRTNCYRWAAISYRMLYDDVGRAVRAVGVLEELPMCFSGVDSWSPDQHPLPEGLLSDLIMRMRADLELDKVDFLWIEGSDLSGQVQDTRCSEILRLEREKIFCKGDQERFLSNFDRDSLLQMYRQGQRWFCAEYRRADRSGHIRWVRHILYLAEDPVSCHVRLFVYLVWLDPGNRLEGVIHSGARRDPVSRVFDRDTIQEMAEALFADRTGGNRAVAVLQVGGLESQSAGAVTDQMRYALAAGLSLVLGGSCLLGQYSPHQFLIVFPDAAEKAGLRRQLEEAVAALRRLLAPDPAYGPLRLIAGVQVMPAAAARYRSMLTQALQVCALWWKAASDTVAFAQDQEGQEWMQLQAGGDNDEVSVCTAEMKRPLSEPEKDLALDCLSAMLSARTLNAALLGVLQALGSYYRADRVYTLMLVENRHAVIMTFEWTSAGRRSIQQVVSGMRLERFPLLIRCMEERAPVFLTRHLPDQADAGDAARQSWHFTALPLIRDPQQPVAGFLCIENAQTHPADAALFTTLIPLMLQQRERFSGGERPSAAVERLMGLPDLSAYLETLYTLSSQQYSSLGVVCLDIPALSVHGGRHSFESGSRMLWYVANTLEELFGSALLFRTREAEFVVFYPNTTREVFLACCGRLRSILQRRYPRQVRIGRAWADGEFTGRQLAKQAQAAMHLELVLSDGAREPAASAEEPSAVRGATHDGRFTVYYQPKINIRTSALSGAEALVRGIGEDGAVIPPSQFIDYLEDAGNIRELDLFVLERSLAQLEQWRSAGLGIVPVAVNLSRATLVHPSTLASVLAIQSRYPEIPASALELEITERGGGGDTAAFRAIADQFHACGLRLSLDDFGSQYANLALFTNVKFDVIKMDRSLIADVVHNPITQTLVQDIVQICRTHHKACVAEGVENQAQLDVLLKMGCPYAQGYYYDQPLPAQVFEEKYLRGGIPVERQETRKEDCI